MQNRKLVSVFTTLGLLVGLLSWAAPAQASHTQQPAPRSIQLFMPENNGADKDQLSDAFDGVDELAHLTAVAGEDIQEVFFFVCDTSTPTETFDESDCFLAGEDSEGVQPQRPEGQEESSARIGDEPDDDEKAFEVFFSTTESGFDDEDADVWALACEADVSYPADFTNDERPDDCGKFDVEEDIYIDNTDGRGNDEVPTGEFVGVCMAHFEQFGQSRNTFSEECDDAEEFRPLIHGDVLSGRNGFYVLFRTMDDVTDSSQQATDAVGACVDWDADHVREPSSCDNEADEVTDTGEGGSSYNEFIASFGPDEVTEEGEADLAIFGESEETDLQAECVSSFASDPDGGGDPDDTCVFSEIYVQFAESDARAVGATFDPDDSRQPAKGADFGDVRGAQTDACDNPDVEETNEIGDREKVIGCLHDAFGLTPADVTETSLTFVSTGVGGIDPASCEGRTDDTDDDGEVDICSEDATDFWCDNNSCNDVTDEGELDVTGNASVELVNNGAAGDQTIVVCADDDDPDDADQGCASGDITSQTLTKHWGGAAASRVDLVFAETEAEGCAGAREFKQNQIGDTDTLVVCTTDEQGNPTSTDELGTDLEWDVENPTVANFTDQPGNPPAETDADGKASATIRANAQGTTDITVCLDDPASATDSCDSVTKTVSGEGPPPPAGRPECSDGVDNDGDGQVDTADPDCTDANDTSENPQGQPLPLCNNNVDDDGDGRTDEQDPGCSGPNDNSESPDPQPPARSNTNTTIRYDESAGAFKGSVGSNRKACSRFRKVVLKKVVPGPNKTVGTDRSNRAGNWKVRKPRANGNFYAVAKRKRFTNRFGRLIICLRDKSPTINV